jgi:hypothetical protein
MLWNNNFLHLNSFQQTQHWLMTILTHLQIGEIFTIINVYMPYVYPKQVDCWYSLIALRGFEFWDKSIVVGDFNTTLG